MRALVALLFLSAAALPPAEEARAAAIDKTLRCVVCKNQSIADSDAALAEGMRDLVRERVAAGDTDDEVRDYMVARYGEFVLLRPEASAQNIGLWALPFLLLAVGGTGAWAFVRASRRTGDNAPLTAEERAELARLRR